MSEDERPLRIKTVAEWLGVSEKTVRRLIDHGEIVSVKIGGLRMIYASIQELLEPIERNGRPECIGGFTSKKAVESIAADLDSAMIRESTTCL